MEESIYIQFIKSIEFIFTNCLLSIFLLEQLFQIGYYIKTAFKLFPNLQISVFPI